MRSILVFSLILSVSFLGCTSQTEQESKGGTGGPIAKDAGASGDLNSLSIMVEEPSNAQPVSIGAAVDKPQAAPGEPVTLVVRAKIAKPWHIYAAEGPTGVGRPTQFELSLPEGVSTGSEWKLPEADVENSQLGPVSSYHGDVRFSVPLNVTPEAAEGSVQIQCKMKYQACTDQSCLPPTSKTLTVPLNIASK